MAYAILNDVQALISKFPVTSTSKPNAVQAAAVINQVSAEIDSVIAAAGRTVPVTTPEWFVEALKLLNCYGAAATILKSMFPQPRGTGESAVAEYSYYATLYRDGLKRLAGPDGIPPDVPTNSATVNPSTYFTRNPDQEEDLGDIAEPFFKRSTPF